MLHRWMTGVVLSLALVVPAQAAVKGEEVSYQVGDTVMKGYLAYDDAIQGKRPGVLVVHEWWGHNEYARRRARMLAELGYTALALDMYGDGKQAHHPEEAGKFAAAVRQDLPMARARFDKARDTLAAHPTVDPSRIAAIGYCFGGAVVLQMARDGADLKAVVSFHGSLGTDAPARPGAVKARILVAHGGDDPFIKPEELEGFRREMDAAKASYVVKVYPGASHSFTNPDADHYGHQFNLPLRYNAEADKQSWADMQALFAQTLR